MSMTKVKVTYEVCVCVRACACVCVRACVCVCVCACVRGGRSWINGLWGDGMCIGLITAERVHHRVYAAVQLRPGSAFRWTLYSRGFRPTTELHMSGCQIFRDSGKTREYRHRSKLLSWSLDVLQVDSQHSTAEIRVPILYLSVQK
jgi:hypothetical protein